jgi:hypothetical protein
MPNQRKPGQHPHIVWVPDWLWAAVQGKALERGESVSEVIRRALTRYAPKDGTK